MIEAFWWRMQVELLDRSRWMARVELTQDAIFQHIEVFHKPPPAPLEPPRQS
jgi:hypothetical protein